MANPQLTILTELFFLNLITTLVYLILIYATRLCPIVYGDFTDSLKYKHCIIPRIIELVPVALINP